MLAIGIDPGTATTGYGLVRASTSGELEAVDWGVILTPAKMPMPERLASIYSSLSELLKEQKPDISAVESLFFQRNVRTAMSVGQARGVVLLALQQAGLAASDYSPNEIKQAVSGYGGADKQQVQSMVKALLNLDEVPKPDDAADALAVAICHMHTAHTRARMQSPQSQNG
jgi:crossover junction endodeoxyribonuclease RuvC